MTDKKRIIVAIDGRCGAGKTTVAKRLAERLNLAVFHMDDFYLQKHQRTEERYNEPGGNVDRERFLEEVLKPLYEGAEEILYRPINCGTFDVSEGEIIRPGRIVIVEGSYSLHPDLRDYYTYKVFLDIDTDAQLMRIEKRNTPEQVEAFKTRWIPLEEKYFEELEIRKYADRVFQMSAEEK